MSEFDDELLCWIYLFLTFECENCGKVELFDEAMKATQGQGTGEDWVLPFARIAVVTARRDGWGIRYDSQRHPHFYCGECFTPGAQHASL